MPGDRYWRERNLKDKALSVNAAEDYIREHAGKMYAQAREEIQGEIEAFYQKYADENGITLQEARRKISRAEFKDIDWEAYCRRSAELERELRAKRDSLPKEIVDRMEQEWEEHEEKIRTLAARGNITRLELLQADIDRNVLNLHDASQMSLYSYLGGQYEDGYYRGIYGIQHHTGFGYGFTTVNTAAVEKALLSQADRRNFSQTIYKNVKNLEREIKDCLTTGMIKGEDMGRMARRVQGRLNVSYSNARRLVRTETAYAYEQASLAAYAECGVTEYEYMAELDHRTSDLCRALDGRHFRTADAVPGTNYPPMHPNCRSTTAAAAFDDAAAHGQAGEYGEDSYPVPSDMSYEEWQKDHTDMIHALTENERHALNQYMSFESYRLNDKLRNDIPLDNVERSMMEFMDSALDKLNNYQGNVVRVLDITDGEKLDEFLREHSAGRIVEYKEYLSTSGMEGYSPEANVKIYIHSTRGKNITTLNPEECEVLYKRNSKFLVDRVVSRDGKIYILMEEQDG